MNTRIWSMPLALLVTIGSASGCAKGEPDKQADTPSSEVFTGKWLLIDHGNGIRAYVDAGSTHDVGNGHKTADIGLTGAGRRTVERVNLDCTTGAMTVVSSAGSDGVEFDLATSPNGPDHATVYDYVCAGKQSQPDASMPIVGTLPVT